MDEKKKDEKKKRGSPQTMQDFLDARERAKRVITLTQFFGIGKKRGALPAKNCVRVITLLVLHVNHVRRVLKNTTARNVLSE